MELAMARPKIFTLSAKELDDIKRRAFVRGSAVTVASYACALSDDALLMWLQAHVRTCVKRQPANPAEVERMVSAICERYGVELRGTRELIRAVYEPTIARGGPVGDSKS